MKCTKKRYVASQQWFTTLWVMKSVGNDIDEKWLKFAKKIDHHRHFLFCYSKPPDNATGLISVSYRSEMINTHCSGLVVALRTLNERDHWLAASSVACSTTILSDKMQLQRKLVGWCTIRKGEDYRTVSTVLWIVYDVTIEKKSVKSYIIPPRVIAYIGIIV